MKSSRIPFETKYKLMMQKCYFDTGFSMIQYAKYFVYIFGAVSFLNRWSMKWVTGMIIGYGLLCYIIGWLYYHSGFALAQNEINNRFNPLAHELRESMKNSKHRKV